MKLRLRFLPDGSLGRLLARSEAFAAARDATGTVFDLDSEDPRVDQLLALARSTGSVDVRLLWRFSAGELRSAPAVRMHLRGPFARETAAETRAHEAALSAVPLGPSPDAVAGSRWLSDLRLDHWTARPGKLCGLQSITHHWLLDRDTADALGAGLSGLHFGAVRDDRGVPRVSPVLFGADARAVPCSRRCTYGQEAFSGVRLVGPLIYDDVTALAARDAWRGAEGFADWEAGELLLSARAHARWQEAKIRGADFEPVWDGRSPEAMEAVGRLSALARALQGVEGTGSIAPLDVLRGSS